MNKKIILISVLIVGIMNLWISSTPTEDVRYLQGIIKLYLKNPTTYVPSQAEGLKMQAALERARANQNQLTDNVRAWLNRKDRAPLLDKLVQKAKTQKPVGSTTQPDVPVHGDAPKPPQPIKIPPISDLFEDGKSKQDYANLDKKEKLERDAKIQLELFRETELRTLTAREKSGTPLTAAQAERLNFLRSVLPKKPTPPAPHGDTSTQQEPPSSNPGAHELMVKRQIDAILRNNSRTEADNETLQYLNRMLPEARKIDALLKKTELTTADKETLQNTDLALSEIREEQLEKRKDLSVSDAAILASLKKARIPDAKTLEPQEFFEKYYEEEYNKLHKKTDPEWED